VRAPALGVLSSADEVKIPYSAGSGGGHGQGHRHRQQAHSNQAQLFLSFIPALATCLLSLSLWL
jgi:hypothetical protein